MIFYALAKVKAEKKGTQSKYTTIKKEAEEGRRRVKFAKLVTSGDEEEDFGEHSLSYTLTVNEVEAKYFSERARDW